MATQAKLNSMGGKIPALFTPIKTEYGTGIVVQHWGDQCVVEFIEFNEDFMHTYETGDPKNPIGIELAEDHVKSFSQAANRTRQSIVSDLLRLEVTLTGNPTKACLERIAAIPTLTDSQNLMAWGAGYKWTEDTEFVTLDVVTDIDGDRLKKLVSVKEVKKMTDELNTDENIPEDILDDIYAELGDYDDLD